MTGGINNTMFIQRNSAIWSMYCFGYLWDFISDDRMKDSISMRSPQCCCLRAEVSEGTLNGMNYSTSQDRKTVVITQCRAVWDQQARSSAWPKAILILTASSCALPICICWPLPVKLEGGCSSFNYPISPSHNNIQHFKKTFFFFKNLLLEFFTVMWWLTDLLLILDKSIATMTPIPYSQLTAVSIVKPLAY